jgi:predicted aspartyl protease
MMRSLAPGVTLLLLLAWTSPSEAQIYRWTDERGVTNYTEGLDSVPEKHRATAVAVGLRNAAPAPAVGGPGAAGPPEKAGGGREIVVEARLNGGTSVRLLLDTGAQRTVINPRVLVAAGVVLSTGQAMQMKGATGTASVSTVQVDSVEVGQARVGKLAVISHDIEQDGVDGLLGRDFLDQFKVSIDNKEGIVTLSPK